MAECQHFVPKNNILFQPLTTMKNEPVVRFWQSLFLRVKPYLNIEFCAIAKIPLANIKPT